MGPLDNLGTHVSEIVNDLVSQPMFMIGDFALTQYMVWMFIAIITLSIIVFTAVKRESLIPKGRFLNGVEALVEFARDSIVRGTISHNADTHGPFLMTLFFLILVNNLWGMVPGGKAGTGTMGVTVALASISFVYFVYWGVKERGVFGYIKSIAPSGIPFPLNLVIWVLELFSTIIRLLTLSVRLFANLFAGHVAMGILALLTSLFVQPLIAQVTGGTLLTATASIGWILLLLMLYTIELVVGIIQAYVFTVLSAVYIDLATSAH